MTVPTREQIAGMIEHTQLKAEATPADIDRLCDEAIEHDFLAVCVHPLYVTRAARHLHNADTFVVSIAGFPFGAERTQTKVDQARRAIDDGAREIDMVLRVGELIAGETNGVRDDIAAVAQAVHGASDRHNLKVIFETAVLTDKQIVQGCRCCAEAGVDFVKTSTGFHAAGGATVHAVSLLHRHAAPIKVKAAGGIRDLATAVAMIDAGAARLGMSASIRIIKELDA